MGDKFAKTYVSERLEARRESLKSKLESGQEAYRAWKQSKDPAALEWTEKAQAQLEELARLGPATAGPDTDPFDQVEALERRLRDIINGAPSRPNSGWRQDRPRDVEVWIKDRSRWQAEVTKIDHALAYLKEMPVTELSITALTKLKLTDAIAFDLTVPAEKKGFR